MAGVTSPLGFPFPTGTDRVADGDNAIQSLAEAVDDYLVNMKIPLVAYATAGLNTGWTGTVHYGMRAGWVHVVMAAIKASWSAGEIMASIPAGYRPTKAFYAAAVASSDATVLSVNVGTDGNITIPLAASKGGVNGFIAYPLGL